MERAKPKAAPGYTLTLAIIAAETTLVPAIARKTIGQGLPAMSRTMLKTMACIPA